jgi:hypothetical protein
LGYSPHIIVNTKKYSPRKISTEDQKRNSISKFDKYDPFIPINKKQDSEYIEAGILVPQNKTQGKNKFDINISPNTKLQKRSKAYSINEKYQSSLFDQNINYNKGNESTSQSSIIFLIIIYY